MPDPTSALKQHEEQSRVALSGGKVSIDDPRLQDVREVLQDHLAFARLHSSPEEVHVLDTDELVDPAVTFFSYRLGGRPLAVAALQELDGRHGELKSMHTVPAARGRGIGRAMLAHVVGVAYERELCRISLETGSGAAFAPARALYASVGFRPCAPFGTYTPSPTMTFMSLTL